MIRPTRTTLSAVALAIASTLGAAAPALAQGDGPELRLFSSTIVEDIRRTGEAAAEMETDVVGSIEEMDRQLELYSASGCEGVEDDSGCGEMRRQLGATYGRMLDAMAEALPPMKEAISRSRDGLQGSLSRELGRGQSPSELMTMLLEDGTAQPIGSRPGGGDGNSLSERFRQYHSLVAGSAGGARRGQGGLALTAADIFLDMQDAVEFIDMTQDQIARSQIFVELDGSMPALTAEMESTVESVKRTLFGESEGDRPAVASLPRTESAEPGAFESDLEL